MNSGEFTKLVSYFKENSSKPWTEWLDFKETFDRPGKQGLVGLFKLKNNENDSQNTDPNNNKHYIFKISQYINYLIHHELVVMNGLNDLAPYCIHFCKSIGSITCDVDPKSRKSGNPFEKSSEYTIEKEVLLCEYIEKSYKLYNYIRAIERIEEDIIYSSVKQVLLAIAIAQNVKRFSHYDLHSFNIMMRKCDKNLVFLYVLDEENQFAVPTLGYYPTIIDFGFSYISDMDDGPLWTSLSHTDVGFMSDRFDWVADPKLFLVSVSHEMRQKRKTKKSKIFRNVVKNIFAPLTIDFECGWDDKFDKGALDYVMELLEKYNTESKLFYDYEHYCFDIIQSLIILPLEKQNYSNIGKYYKIFLTEWIKIENEIGSPFYNLYILKGIVDAARHNRSDYYSEERRQIAISTFTNMLHDRINKVSKFCLPKKIHYEKLLCSLLVLSRCIEGKLYEVINNQMAKKQKEYDKLPLTSTEQIYAAIESNIPDTYTYSKNTTVCVMNVVAKTYDVFNLPDECVNTVNKLHSLVRGTYLYDIYKICK